MKRLFISQPMRGRSDEEIRAEREEIRREVERQMGEEVEVIDSFFHSGDMKPLECLGESIKMMASADGVYFAKGWEKAKGCGIEFRCAAGYGVPIIRM